MTSAMSRAGLLTLALLLAGCDDDGPTAVAPSPAQQAPDLDTLCAEDVPLACLEADWARAGFPPRAQKRGPLHDDGLHLARSALPHLVDCGREALDVDPSDDGVKWLYGWVDEDGLLQALSAGGHGPFEACLVEALVGADLSGPAWARHVTVPVGYHLRAGIEVAGAGGFVEADTIDAVTDVLASVEPALRACSVDRSGNVYDSVRLRVRMNLSVSGRLSKPKLLESIGDDEVDACMLAVMEGAPPATGIETPERLGITVHTFEVERELVKGVRTEAIRLPGVEPPPTARGKWGQ